MHFADPPVISLEPAQKTKRITTIDQWITAFQTFVTIYTVRFPNDAPALMKYSETVRDLAAKNVHWRYYDENFRFFEAKNTSPLGPNLLGTVVAGAPHAKTRSCCFASCTQQKFKTALSARLLLEISQRGKMFWLQLQSRIFQMWIPAPSNKCACPRRTTNQTSNMSRNTTTTTAGSSKSVTPPCPFPSTVNTNQSR